MTKVLFLVMGDSGVTQLGGFQELMVGVWQWMKGQNVKLEVEFVGSMDEARSLDFDALGVDGVLAHARVPIDPTDDGFAGLPTVWLMSNPVRPSWGDQVMPDSGEIGRLAAEYLVGAGRQCLAYLDMSSGHWGSKLRSRPFADYCQELGAEVDVVRLSAADADRCGVSSVDVGRSGNIAEAADLLIDEMLRRCPGVDGLFMASGNQAAILVPALQRRGRTVGPGKDIEIISSANDSTYLLGLQPCPPSIDIHVDEIGRRGAAQLLYRIAEPRTAQQARLTVLPSLVIREPAPSLIADVDPGDSV